MTDKEQQDRAARRPKPKNMAASVQSRLNKLARDRGEATEYLMTRYAIERFLYRLGQSSHGNEFILKGALLFAIWEGHPHRITRDLDLLGFGPSDAGRLEQAFHDVCTAPVEDDGIIFVPETIRTASIREQQEYGGIRTHFTALLGSARIRVQVDVGFGDAVTPAAQTVEFPTLLDLPAPQLRAYPRDTVVAEKFEAMVRLGMANSRMKDFYDQLVISRQFAFDGPTLASALRATFSRRSTDLPQQLPVALTDEFSNDTGKLIEWRAFLNRNKLEPSSLALPGMVAELCIFLLPVVQAFADEVSFADQWAPGGPWQPPSTDPTPN